VPLRLAFAALVVMVASWGPLFVVGTLDPTVNPIGLGLLGLAGTCLAAVLLTAAAVVAIRNLL
jgi:hypothetical protein